MSMTVSEKDHIIAFQPVLSTLSGVVILQFFSYWTDRINRSSKPRLISVMCATAFGLHMLQLLSEVWILFNSATSTRKDYCACYQYGAFGTYFTLSIALIVQFHFSRITFILIDYSKAWIVLTCLLALITTISGFGTAMSFTVKYALYLRNDLIKPRVFSRVVVGLYLSWLASAVISNLSILVILGVSIKFQRRRGVQKKLRDVFERLRILTLSALALNAFAALLSMICVAISHLFPHIDINIRLRLQSVSFIVVSFSSRLYLISFLWSLSPFHITPSPDFGSCVAPLPSQLSG
ncbi:expressed protein [Phakopsora pachyrhizi]|uniref:Expressed protein n=1 Tax=Phakopsora pachyrhizi TaxID=170000 RepID=A0AAV0BBD1_PHAPC|nr:expressed protein [Phakopsora pachyrhizi]